MQEELNCSSSKKTREMRAELSEKGGGGEKRKISISWKKKEGGGRELPLGYTFRDFFTSG